MKPLTIKEFYELCDKAGRSDYEIVFGDGEHLTTSNFICDDDEKEIFLW